MSEMAGGRLVGRAGLEPLRFGANPGKNSDAFCVVLPTLAIGFRPHPIARTNKQQR
jgi:hypothetical protein